MAAEIIFQDGNWVGMFNGKKVVRSYDQTRVVKMMARAGHKNAPIRGEGENTAPQEQDAQAQWPINQRFEFVAQLVNMVARGLSNSVVITGPGGLGKTYTVRAALAAAGLKDISGKEVDGSEGTYRVVKGYSTAKGLYRTLFENNNSTIVFDDCDSIQKDPIAVNLLKSALDSYDERIISWNADLKDEDLPKSFRFGGRVIFISNMAREQLDKAIRTRAYCIDLMMTTDQKLERMAVLAESEDFMPRFSNQHKADALALINELKDSAQELSLRTLMAVTKIRAAGGNWEPLARYTLVNHS